jgi:hypothetical protein
MVELDSGETSDTVLRWNLQSSALARQVLGPRCANALSVLQAGTEAGQLAFLRDTRALHLHLFADLAPPGLPQAAGTYRGTQGPLARAERAVFLARRAPGLRFRDLCCRAADVGPSMKALALRIEAVWQARPSEDVAFADLAAISHEFFRIHPFLDGNGHIYRIMMALLGPQLGLLPRTGWTLHQRPYDHHMSLCLQWFSDHPELLACYLRKWFEKTSIAATQGFPIG